MKHSIASWRDISGCFGSGIFFSRADKSYPATWRLSDSKHSTVWLSVPIYSKIGPPDHSQMLTAKQVLPQSLP